MMSCFCNTRWKTGARTNTTRCFSLKDGVIDVRRRGDRIILVRIVVGDSAVNMISAYAPQVGISESNKRQFWEDLDSMVSTVPVSEKLLIGGDLNGHVGVTNVGFERVHGGFGYGSRSQEGEDVLNFAFDSEYRV